MARCFLIAFALLGFLIVTTAQVYAASGIGAEAPTGNVPQHAITGTDSAMFNGVSAERLSTSTRNALAAIGRCDEKEYEQAKNEIDQLFDNVNDPDNVSGHEGVNEYLSLGMFVDQDAADLHTIGQVKEFLAARWAARQPCEKTSIIDEVTTTGITGEEPDLVGKGYEGDVSEYPDRAQLSIFFVEMFAKAGFIDAVTSGHTGVNSGFGDNTNKIRSDKKGSTSTKGIKARVNVGAQPVAYPGPFTKEKAPAAPYGFGSTGRGSGNNGGWFSGGGFDVFTELSRTTTDYDDSFAGIGTGGGTFLITGTGDPTAVSPSGFFLPFAGGLNTLTSATYRAEHRETAGELGLGKTVIRGNTSIRPFAGLEYSRLNSSETFNGTIAGFATSFEYNTLVENHVFSPFIGVEAAHRPSWASVAGTQLEFFGSARYAYNINDADGTDNLVVSGGAFDRQSVDLSEDENTNNFRFGAGVTFNPDGPFSVSVGGEVERRENLPVVQRLGSSPSELKFKGANGASGTVRGTIRF